MTIRNFAKLGMVLGLVVLGGRVGASPSRGNGSLIVRYSKDGASQIAIRWLKRDGKITFDRELLEAMNGGKNVEFSIERARPESRATQISQLDFFPVSISVNH